MSQQVGVLDITFIAKADMSSSPYHIVKLSTASPFNVELCTENGKAIGILQNKPQAGEAALVRVLGTSKLKCNDTGIAVGDYITNSSVLGVGEEADATPEFCIGMAMESVAASGDIIEILIDRFINAD